MNADLIVATTLLKVRPFSGAEKKLTGFTAGQVSPLQIKYVFTNPSRM